MLLMLFSLIVLALPITIIGANFDEEYRLNRMREMCARWVGGAATTSAATPHHQSPLATRGLRPPECRLGSLEA